MPTSIGLLAADIGLAGDRATPFALKSYSSPGTSLWTPEQVAFTGVLLLRIEHRGEVLATGG